MNSAPLVIERILDAPVEKVWKAITDPGQMKLWYFDLQGFKLEPGNEFSFEGRNEDRCYVHLCKITEVIEGRKLSYTWRYEGHQGNSLLSFELSPEGNKTRLKLTHAGLETFPQNLPDFAGNNFVVGWNWFLDKSLPEFLEKTV
jgi:uncharacterized protein YndB with AHSA1/START domain